MPPRSEEQFEAIRQERKESLKASALKLFANKGFTATSVMDIAKDAGVSKGLLYNYYTNKTELVRDIIKAGFQTALQEMDFDFTQKLDEERMKELILKNFALIESNTDFWKLYIAVITQPAVAEMVMEEIFKILEPFFTIVATYYSEKGVKNPMAYAYLLGAIFDGVGIDYMFDPEHYPLNDIKEIIIEKFIA
ncbi:MAG: TetR/AcrR family transcriptional regulator [Bacteroidales bacterium]|nr:TetR/AcrR family transcriptional regulator [Bacteroidales bacterium]